MRKYLKGTYRKIVRLFSAKNDTDYTVVEKELDAADAHNTKIYTDIIKGLLSEKYSYATIKKGNYSYALTKSLYNTNFIQLTYFYNDKPTGHREVKKAKEINDFPDGCYINIALE